ncbi:hypothetical protein GBAR_LOCUS4364, partial [Geodia barretti]
SSTGPTPFFPTRPTPSSSTGPTPSSSTGPTPSPPSTAQTVAPSPSSTSSPPTSSKSTSSNHSAVIGGAVGASLAALLTVSVGLQWSTPAAEVGIVTTSAEYNVP